MEKIETEEQLEKALSSERAVIIIRALWAVQSALSFHVLKNWVDEWNTLSPHLKLEIYWIDTDHDCVEEWVERLIKPNGELRHDAESVRFKNGCVWGIGPFMWIKSGSATGFEQSALAVGSSSGLTRRAQEIYND